MRGLTLCSGGNGRRNQPCTEVVMSSNPTTLEIENSNIPEGACVLPPNTSEGWAVAIHAAACRCVVLVNIDHTEKKRKKKK